MREILFRGKRIDNGEWIEGSLINDGRCFIAIHPSLAFGPTCKDEINGETLWGLYPFFEVDPSTVGQYTGLTDKNGKRIFEGDIVYYSCSDISAIIKQGQYTDIDLPNKPAVGYYVEYLEDGKTFQESIDSRECDEEYGCEVIGNATDNPELLEVGE